MLKQISATEKIILLFAAAIVSTGAVLYFSNISAFHWFVMEDGIVEWLTVAGLITTAIVCFHRLVFFFRRKTTLFLFVTLGLGLAMVFVAGEEISWGQRIFNFKSPDYFLKNNSQQETNIHNLIFKGIRINKAIFTYLLMGTLALYLLVLPVLFNKHKGINRIINSCGIPVARAYQVIAFVVALGLTSCIPHGKSPELLECCGVLLFYLVVRFPQNKATFR